MDVFQTFWYRLIVLFVAIQATVLWFVLGPSSPGCALTVLAGTFALGPAVAAPVMRRVPRNWFRVSPGERALHRIVGVGIFGLLLDVSGWNRLLAKPMRRFSGSRAGLFALEESLQGNVSAHGTCFTIHGLLAVLALFSPHPWSAALWMLLPGSVVHLYPVLLQRSIMLRLQSALDKSGRPRPNPPLKSVAAPKTLRARCREEIARRLVPEIKRRGFVGSDEIRGNVISHGFERRTEKQLERLSIQFDKHQRPRFILNVQIDPPEGSSAYERNGGTMLLGRIAPGGGFGTGGWFRADTPWWKRLWGAAATSEAEAVSQALSYLDAIDEWFRSPRQTEAVSFTALKILSKNERTER